MLMPPLFVILFAALFLFLPVTTGTVWVPSDSFSKETKEQHNGLYLRPKTLQRLRVLRHLTEAARSFLCQAVKKKS